MYWLRGECDSRFWWENIFEEIASRLPIGHGQAWVAVSGRRIIYPETFLRATSARIVRRVTGNWKRGTRWKTEWWWILLWRWSWPSWSHLLFLLYMTDRGLFSSGRLNEPGDLFLLAENTWGEWVRAYKPARFLEISCTFCEWLYLPLRISTVKICLKPRAF